jgi:hypothetical protein
MRYFVLDDQGTKYGPADLATLNQWAVQGRIAPNTTLVEEFTNVRHRAIDLPGLHIAVMPGMPAQGLPTQNPGAYGAPGQGAYGQMLPGASPVQPQYQPTNTGPFNNPIGTLNSGQNEANISFGLSILTLILCAVIPCLGLLSGIPAIFYAGKAMKQGSPSGGSAMSFAVLVTAIVTIMTLGVASLFSGFLGR